MTQGTIVSLNRSQGGVPKAPVDQVRVSPNGMEGDRQNDRRHPGRRLQLGAVEVEITSFAVPCKTIRRAFAAESFTRISQGTYPGWSRVYARVLKEGLLQLGERVTLLTP